MSITTSIYVVLILAAIAGYTLASAARTILGSDNSTRRLFVIFLIGYMAHPLVSQFAYRLAEPMTEGSTIISGPLSHLIIALTFLRLVWLIIAVRFVAQFGSRETMQPWYPAITLALCALGIALVFELPVQLLVVNLKGII